MPQAIFFSWQIDTGSRGSRNLIEWALNRAIRELKADADIDPADRELHIDRDTANVPGSPPLVETIFGKIDEASAFVSDLTFVGTRADGRRKTPNPNVLLEHGWALRSLTWRRVIGVMNTAFGHPDEHALPFDLQHFRRPILFHCPDDAAQEERATAREALAADLVKALKAILTDDWKPAGRHPAEPHPHDVALVDKVRRLFDRRLRILLHRHNFGDRYRRHLLDPLHDMEEDWVGAEYEFEDAKLQASFAELRARVGTFTDLILKHAFAIDRQPDFAWVRTDYDLRHELQESTLAAIRAINSAAREVTFALDEFERVARAKVRVAAGEEGAAAPDLRGDQAMTAFADLSNRRVRGEVPAIVARPRYVLQMVPFEAMEGRRLDPKQVAALFPRFPPNLDDRVVEKADADQWWVCAVPDQQGPARSETRWLMRLVRPGLLEFSAIAGYRGDDDTVIPIDGRALEAEIVRGFERMRDILVALGFAGPALIGITIEGTEDVILTRGRAGGGDTIKAPFFSPLPCGRIEDLTQPIAPSLQEPFDRLWQSSGWADGSPSFTDGGWSPPAR